MPLDDTDDPEAYADDSEIEYDDEATDLERFVIDAFDPDAADY